MKAARLQDGNLEIQDVPVPVPEFEEALIKISSTGVCHSDLHLVRGDWEGTAKTRPLGHEAVGVVKALGPGAERYISVGDRVILGLGGTGGGFWCGACEYCLAGKPRHCSQAKGITGAYAEELCVYAKSLVILPDHVGDEEAPLACGGLTAYNAVKKLAKHQVFPGKTVAIIGAAGGLGHYAVQIANAFGYRVVGVDIGKERLDFVKSLGAEFAVNPDKAKEFAESKFDGVDASIIFSSRMAGFDLGLEMLKRGGLYVGVGLPPSSEGNIQINPMDFFYKDPTMIFAAVGTVQDMRELVDLAAAGKVKSHIGRVGALTELGTMFDELESGKIIGRAVVTDLGN